MALIVKAHLLMPKDVINNALKWMEDGPLGHHGPHATKTAFSSEDDNVLTQLQNMVDATAKVEKI